MMVQDDDNGQMRKEEPRVQKEVLPFSFEKFEHQTPRV
jgi:hypothetical protein